MQKLLKVLVFIFLILGTVFFALNIEKVFIGVKYSFRSFQSNGNVIFLDPFNKKMVIYDLVEKSVVYSHDHVGDFVINVYQYDDCYFVVDRVGRYVAKVSDEFLQMKRLSFQRRIQGSLMQGDKIYVLLEGGELHIVDKELNRVSTYKFSGAPSYIFSWNKKVFATYLWNDNYDIEFINETPKDLGLTTPSMLVGDLLIDTRGGQVYNLRTGKSLKLASYLSSAFYDGTNYYIACMSSSAIYIVKNDTVQSSFKVPYTPTAVKKVGEFIVVLSAPYNKVMVTTDGKNVEVYETGDYPLEIFGIKNLQNAFSIYCSDNGYMYYYYF